MKSILFKIKTNSESSLVGQKIDQIGSQNIRSKAKNSVVTATSMQLGNHGVFENKNNGSEKTYDDR